MLAAWWLNTYHAGLLPWPGLVAWIALGVNAVVAVCAVLARQERRVDPFEPVYFVTLLFLVLFVVRPLQLIGDSEVRPRFLPDDPRFFQYALLLGGLGLVCFIVGYRSRAGVRVSALLPRFSNEWQHRRVVLTVLVYTLLGIGSLWFALARSGAVGMLSSVLVGRRLLAQAGTWAIGWGVVLVHVATLIVGAYWARTRRLGALLAASVAFSMGAVIVVGGRETFVVDLLALLVMFHYLRRGTRRLSLGTVATMAAFACLAVLFIVVLGAARKEAVTGQDIYAVDLVSAGAIRRVLTMFMSEFGQFDWFVIVLGITPAVIPFQFGKTYLELAAWFVPRAIWPGKPWPISYVVHSAVGGSSAGMPFTMIGEMYLNFHVPGIVIGMALFGVLLKTLYVYLRTNRDSLGIVLVYAYVYASLHLLFTRSFAPMVMGLILALAPMVLAVKFIEQRSASSDGAPVVAEGGG
jgi:oligosaccharide repeat unit polymerase